jgi:hypothetical protein
MDPVFTLPYSEYAVVEKITKHLRKRDGFSIYVPASRQEKDVDFLVHSSVHNKSVRFQVKGSRSYVRDDQSSLDKGHLKYTLWFNNFRKKYSPGNADFYVLFGLYPNYSINSAISSRRQSWRPLILCIPDAAMGALLDSVRTKKTKEPDRFFYVAFDSPDQVYGTRGFLNRRDLSEYLLDRQMPSIRAKLTSRE